MTASRESQKKGHASTYFVQDRASKNELVRVKLQDELLTTGMGGVLPEQQDPSHWTTVLDVGCGSGYWLVETAKAYPNLTSLVGIDLSKTMIEHAHKRAEEQHVSDRVQFRVMDAMQPLDFLSDSFDLVNLRFGSSYLRTWDWVNVLSEFKRITKYDGVVRVTEPDMVESNSKGLDALQQILVRAFYQAGNTFVPQLNGITSELTNLFTRSGFRDVQSKPYALRYEAGSAGSELLYENMRHSFRNLVPFFNKWTQVPADYEKLYQEMLQEMQQPDFSANWPLLTVWGKK